ncbi:hypothetical protein DFH11DRAFT_1725766 [Phellopilus nigrolimitatus]|nr:hypothetical protein DFH11DRAFT_1725766 [Phellopilus nigrolimitatus]
MSTTTTTITLTLTITLTSVPTDVGSVPTTAPAPVHLGDADGIDAVVVPSGAAALSAVAEGLPTHGTHSLMRPDLRMEKDAPSITDVPMDVDEVDDDTDPDIHILTKAFENLHT